MAAVVSNGYNWADGEICEQKSVMFITGEDDKSQVYVPRLMANQADLTKITFFDRCVLRQRETEEILDEDYINITAVDRIREAINKTHELTGLPVGLVVVDPIDDFLGNIDANSSVKYRNSTKPIRNLAAEMEFCLLFVDHKNKWMSDGCAMNRVNGTQAKTSTARCVWMLSPDPDDRSQKLLLPSKGNNTKNEKGVKFCLKNTILKTNFGDAEAPRVEIIDAHVNLHADDVEQILLRKTADARRGGGEEKQTKLVEVVLKLQEILKDGPKLLVDIKEELEVIGVSERTLINAKNKLRIETCYKGVGVLKKTYWKLPK